LSEAMAGMSSASMQRLLALARPNGDLECGDDGDADGDGGDGTGVAITGLSTLGIVLHCTNIHCTHHSLHC
jgi:hypothetical protein